MDLIMSLAHAHCAPTQKGDSDDGGGYLLLIDWVI